MKALNIDTPEDEIPETPNASPMSLDEFDDDDFEDFGDEDDSEDETEETGSEDVSEMSVKELRLKCEELGIDTKGLKKDELIEALNSNSEIEE